jgi:hypothetical protein
VGRLEGLLEGIKDFCGPFRRIRNKRVAHLDLMSSLKVDPDPLPGISREMVESALSAVRDFMNEFGGCFCNSATAYEHFRMQGDGEALIWQLKRAADYRDGVQDGSIAQERLAASRYYGA